MPKGSIGFASKIPECFEMKIRVKITYLRSGQSHRETGLELAFGAEVLDAVIDILNLASNNSHDAVFK